MQSIRNGRPRTPQATFDRVAKYYDVLNSVLSVGLDRRWRRRAVVPLELRPGMRVLDVATGTGALVTEITRLTGGTVSITGCDLNERMLSIAKERVARDGSRIDLIQCDATRLPFEEESFDAVTIAFGLDDMPDRDACMREMWRVLRPGGRLAVLELGQPDLPVLGAAYRLYLRTFRLLSFFSVEGYRHLEQEILKYRGPAAVESLVVSRGFEKYRRESLTWGIARLHVAEKARELEGGAS